MIQRIAIIGVGLIGGSLGLAWKNSRPDLEVVGFDEPAVLDRAHARGAIDLRAASPEAAVRGADVVVLATPLSAILHHLGEIAPYLKAGAVVTDVGSVKRPVLQQADEVLPGAVAFIGGHPMAGSQQGGIDNADALLFSGATFALCPPSGLEHRITEVHPDFLDLVRATGANVLVLDAERHDRIAATVSHLPQLLATTLMNYAATENGEDDLFLRLAAGGFRDMTRIASSPFDMWRDVIIGNHGPILDALAGFAAAFQRMRNRVAEEDLEALEQAFGRSREVRDTIPADTRGFLHPLSDVYVYAEDRPGELLDIARTLHEAELDVRDIQLLKIREGHGGAFRIGFADKNASSRAVTALQQEGFTAYQF